MQTPPVTSRRLVLPLGYKYVDAVPGRGPASFETRTCIDAQRGAGGRKAWDVGVGAVIDDQAPQFNRKTGQHDCLRHAIATVVVDRRRAGTSFFASAFLVERQVLFILLAASVCRSRGCGTRIRDAVRSKEKEKLALCVLSLFVRFFISKKTKQKKRHVWPTKKGSGEPRAVNQMSKEKKRPRPADRRAPTGPFAPATGWVGSGGGS